MEDIEYWVNFSFDKMKKDNIFMPKTLNIVLQMDEFKKSGITEKRLRSAIKKRFEQERMEILKKFDGNFFIKE